MPAILQYLTRALAAQQNVFAHVVMGNTAAHTLDTWSRDIKLAADKGIDAFVLNIAYPDSNMPQQISNAFQAAEKRGSNFKLFFSFDYLGGGAPWPATCDDGNCVVGILNKYKDSPAHFKVDNKPIVSTFEGISNIPDWAYGGPIRNLVGDLHFVPDWSSLGPDGIKQHRDKIEGAFSWDMWPEGPTDKDVGSDEAWQAALGDKHYMMGVSPWFFRSAEGGKNWIWKGDDLWTYRWAQAKKLAPRFVQIVTWNDYGESHYIGPNPDASEIPTGSHDFVEPLAHTGWLSLLPYHISQYKGTKYVQPFDKLTFWYRDAPCKAGDSSWVVGNNVNQGQKELPSVEIMSDNIFLSSWLTAPGQVQVKIGDNAPTTFEGKQGFNHWSQALDGQRGVPTFSVLRNGKTIYSKDGREISDKTQLASGKTNFNAYVGSF